jgi:hypothetical protein
MRLNAVDERCMELHRHALKMSLVWGEFKPVGRDSSSTETIMGYEEKKVEKLSI